MLSLQSLNATISTTMKTVCMSGNRALAMALLVLVPQAALAAPAGDTIKYALRSSERVLRHRGTTNATMPLA